MSVTEKNSEQRFSSRWGFLLSALGIAIGTGNIWRFPRIVAQNGSDQGGGLHFDLDIIPFSLECSLDNRGICRGHQ